VTLSIAVAEADITSVPDLIDQADIALGTAKSSGKGRVVLFEPSMIDQIAARRKIGANLTTADVWKEFEPFCQLIVEIASGRVVGSEAIARWSPPDGTCIWPAKFIPVAETSGKIIDDWPCDAVQGLSGSGGLCRPGGRVGQAGCASSCSGGSGSNGPSPERLKLEIKESVFMNDMLNVKQLIDTLKKMGVTVSLATLTQAIHRCHIFGAWALMNSRSIAASYPRSAQASVPWL
jgi:ammonium transporter, Amt family